MSLFGEMTREGHEEAEDRIGGFSPLETDLYPAKVKVAYAGKSDGGAMNITAIFDLGNREYRETIYVTDKTGKNYFLNKNDNTKKVSLPGFVVIDDLCLMTTEKALSDQETEEKVVNIYDYDAKKELPKSVQVLTELTGKEIYLGIVKQIENKNVKEGNEYVPTADTRETNYIDKVFHHPTKLTVKEAQNKMEPAFCDAWTERNKGNTRDKRTIKDGAAGRQGRPAGSAPQAGDTTTAPRKSLFG